MVIALDLKGIACSTGAACSSARSAVARSDGIGPAARRRARDAAPQPGASND